jgi:hypothetical protein
MKPQPIALLHEKTKLPLFHVYYDICVCPKMDVAKEHMQLFYPGLDYDITPDALALTMVINTPTTTGFLVVINNNNKILGRPDMTSTIVHECTHLSWYIIEALGITIDADNHEIQAYMLEELVRTVTNAVADASGIIDSIIPEAPSKPDKSNDDDLKI